MPRQVIGSDVAVGTLIQQGLKSRFSLQNRPRSFRRATLAGDNFGKVHQLIPVNGGEQNAPIHPR